MAEESDKQPVMNENSRYPATLPRTLPLLAGEVRRHIEQDEDMDDED